MVSVRLLRLVQSAICCALLAAVKIAHLSERSTSSQEAM